MDFVSKTTIVHLIIWILTMDVNVSAECTDVFSKEPTFKHCQYRCHCIDNVQCDEDTGHCPNGCNNGWMGYGCQTRNLGIYHNQTRIQPPGNDKPSRIVDGNDKTCVTTDIDSGTRHEWSTQLDRPYQVKGIVIKIPHSDIFHNFRVETAGSINDADYFPTVCFHYTSTTTMTINTSIYIECQQTIPVQQLRIMMDTPGQRLTLCEVEIFGPMENSTHPITNNIATIVGSVVAGILAVVTIVSIGAICVLKLRAQPEGIQRRMRLGNGSQYPILQLSSSTDVEQNEHHLQSDEVQD